MAYNNERPDFSDRITVKHVDLDAMKEALAFKYDSYMKLYAQYATDSQTAGFTGTLASDFVDDLRRDINKHQVVGAFIDNRMVGIAAWSKRRGKDFLWSFWVDPLFARCGVGRALLENIEQKLSQNKRVWSVRTVEQSVGFFEKAGYATTSYGRLLLCNGETFKVAYMRKKGWVGSNSSAGFPPQSLIYPSVTRSCNTAPLVLQAYQ